MHIVAQVNHSGLGVKVEKNCLRDSDLIPCHSFLSTTFPIFINGVLKFMCVCVFSGADKTNFSSDCLNANSKSVLLLWFLTVTCSCCPYLLFGSPIM